MTEWQAQCVRQQLDTKLAERGLQLEKKAEGLYQIVDKVQEPEVVVFKDGYLNDVVITGQAPLPSKPVRIPRQKKQKVGELAKLN